MIEVDCGNVHVSASKLNILCKPFSRQGTTVYSDMTIDTLGPEQRLGTAARRVSTTLSRLHCTKCHNLPTHPTANFVLSITSLKCALQELKQFVGEDVGEVAVTLTTRERVVFACVPVSASSKRRCSLDTFHLSCRQFG